MNFLVSRPGQRLELKVKMQRAGCRFSFVPRVADVPQASASQDAADEGNDLKADMLWVSASWTTIYWLLLLLKGSQAVRSTA